MSPKKITRRIWKSAAAGLLSLSLLVPAASSAWAEALTDAAAADQMKEVLELLTKTHVGSPSSGSLSDAAIKAMIGSLKDPYTQYFSPKELENFSNAVENQYVGIGIRIGEDTSTVYAAEVFDGSPAMAAGMQSGDKIIAVDGEPTAGKTVSAIIDKIMGEEGSFVTIRVQRGEETIDLKMKRGKIQLPTVVRKLFQPGVGYIQVTGFSSDSDEKMAQELTTLKSQGIKSLIVDLRDNPGGLLDSALNMAKLFVKEGVLIHTRDRDNVDDPVEIKGGTSQPFPVYFLVNENSASASEVLTGALQDYGVITVIGTKTYGKGSVQTLFPLQSGGAVKITIEEYLTPKLRKVNKVGLEPDRKVEGDLPQLIAALRLAGAELSELSFDRTGLSLNGVTVLEPFNVIRQNGKLYVPARSMSAVLNANVEWNESTRSVEIASDEGRAVYGSDAPELLMNNGTSYVTIDSIAQVFNRVNWQDDGGKLTVTLKKL